MYHTSKLENVCVQSALRTGVLRFARLRLSARLCFVLTPYPQKLYYGCKKSKVNKCRLRLRTKNPGSTTLKQRFTEHYNLFGGLQENQGWMIDCSFQIPQGWHLSRKLPAWWGSRKSWLVDGSPPAHMPGHTRHSMGSAGRWWPLAATTTSSDDPGGRSRKGCNTYTGLQSFRSATYRYRIDADLNFQI